MLHPSNIDASSTMPHDETTEFHPVTMFDPEPRWEAGYGSLGAHGHWTDTDRELPIDALLVPLTTPLIPERSLAREPHDSQSWWSHLKAWLHAGER